MSDENTRDRLEKMTLKEAIYQYLPSDPTFFEKDTADRIINIAKDYSPESMGTKLEVALVAATTIPVINELTMFIKHRGFLREETGFIGGFS